MKKPVATAVGPDEISPDAISDEALVPRVVRADRQAFATLLDRHGGRAHGYAARLLGNPSEAEDVVQDAFLKLWSDAARFEPDRGRFQPWFYRLLHNLCIDRLRRRRTVGLEVVAERPSDEPGPEQQMAETMQNEHLARALTTLPERQRAAVLMCYFRGLSNREAAEVLDVGIKGLEALLVRARRQLAKVLGDTPGFGER